MQDIGTSWEILVRGPKQQVDWYYNAFYNFGAVNEKDYTWNYNETEASFFTTKKRMAVFFHNFWVNHLWHEGTMDDAAIDREAAIRTIQSMLDLFDHHREVRRQYSSSDLTENLYDLGIVKAENPDPDLKDLILENAFKPLPSVKEQPSLTDEVGDMFAELQGV
jgi:hypothetical protein